MEIPKTAVNYDDHLTGNPHQAQDRSLSKDVQILGWYLDEEKIALYLRGFKTFKGKF